MSTTWLPAENEVPPNDSESVPTGVNVSSIENGVPVRSILATPLSAGVLLQAMAVPYGIVVTVGLPRSLSGWTSEPVEVLYVRSPMSTRRDGGLSLTLVNFVTTSVPTAGAPAPYDATFWPGPVAARVRYSLGVPSMLSQKT